MSAHSRQAAWHVRTRPGFGGEVRPHHQLPLDETVAVENRESKRGRDGSARRSHAVGGESFPRAPHAVADRSARELRFHPTRGERRFDDEIGEMIEDIAERSVRRTTTSARTSCSSSPSSDRHRRGRNAGSAGFQQPGAEGVRDRDVPAPHGVNKPWYPEERVRAQFERVAEVSSSRRKITSTGCSPPSTLRKTRLSRTVRSPPSTSV